MSKDFKGTKFRNSFLPIHPSTHPSLLFLGICKSPIMFYSQFSKLFDAIEDI
jgi:hypothetical protein